MGDLPADISSCQYEIEGDNKPVVYVNNANIKDFLTKLNEKTGMAFSLPTEAEWEFAARGGNKSQGYKYSGSNTISEVAWYKDNNTVDGKQGTHAVGTKAPNELGIYDMTGNVYERVGTAYASYSSASQVDPRDPESGPNYVARGGTWCEVATHCRVSTRDYNTADFVYFHQGFRIAL